MTWIHLKENLAVALNLHCTAKPNLEHELDWLRFRSQTQALLQRILNILVKQKLSYIEYFIDSVIIFSNSGKYQRQKLRVARTVVHRNNMTTQASSPGKPARTRTISGVCSTWAVSEREVPSMFCAVLESYN